MWRTCSSGAPPRSLPDVRVIFVQPGGDFGTLEEHRLDDTTERHLIALPPPVCAPGDPIVALTQADGAGLVVALAGGCPSRAELRLLKRALASQRRAWLHW